MPRHPHCSGASLAAGFLCAVLSAGIPCVAAETTTAPQDAGIAALKIASSVRATSAITVDGTLDEPAWADATAITDFVQRFPAEGAPASQATSVRILYDDETLHIGAMLYDAEPDKIIALELKEDGDLDDDDVFGIMIDTFHDRRNAFYFETNPNGARGDALVYDEGRTVSFDWDGVWEVAAQRTAEGWSLEIAIPFRTLNFNPDKVNPWGLQIWRGIRRNAEDVFWAPVPRNEDLWRISRAGELHGLEGIRQGSRGTLKPYALGRASELPTLGQEDTDETGDIGFDARYSITPNLVGVLTYNTDFAETEVDLQEVNITRFPLFFPEKREYFLESTGFFDFGFNPPDSPGGPSVPIPFFSRRVGLAEGSDLPIPIQGGVKLVGRMGRYNLGALSINADEDGGIPQTNFSALRVSRDIMTRSNWGVVGVSKEPAGSDFDPNGALRDEHSNRTYGADVNFSVLENFKFGGSFLQTDTPETTEGDGSGHVYTTWSDNTWRVEANYRDVGEDFNPEAGFVERTGIENTEVAGGWSWRSDTALVRRVEPHTRINYTTDQDHDMATRIQHYGTTFEMRDSSFVEVAWNTTFDRLDETFVLDEEDMVEVRPGEYSMDTYFVHWEGDESRLFSASLFYEWGDFFDGDISSLDLGVVARLSKYLRASLSLNQTAIDLPARADDAADPNDTSLPASEFDFTLIQGQIGVRFTTTLFLDTLLQYNTDIEDFSSDLRLNWKYRPGSDIYVVYRERRDIEGETTDLTDRVFTVKWTYQLAF